VTQTGGFPVRTAWLIFAALLGASAFFVLRPAKEPEQAEWPHDPPALA
jgi:hypothetical protein